MGHLQTATALEPLARQGDLDLTNTVVPGTMPVEPRRRSWRVIHACEYARDVLPVIEGQVAAGMRPYIVTPVGAGTAEVWLSGCNQEPQRNLSLLRAWQDVRTWRRSLLDCDPETAADLVHTHSFSSGMAAVRNCTCVVYDLQACIEDLAVASGQCETGSWIGRSFRVAEQFILSRASAIVVHSAGMKAAAEERGAHPESIFVIPEPLEAGPMEASAAEEADGLPELRALAPGTVTFFTHLIGTQGPEESSLLLEAFTLALAALPQHSVKFIVASPLPTRALLQEHIIRLGMANHVIVLEEAAAKAAAAMASVVIAGSEVPDNLISARSANPLCLTSLARGRALLAADVPRNREASPDGQGCLWFNPGDVRDLSRRVAFLAQNPGFCKDLGMAGRSYMLETRRSEVIGKRYEAVYRYAASHRRSRGIGPTAVKLLPAVV
jgi:glycosyltransferase involved in cell wall biosynthesis